MKNVYLKGNRGFKWFSDKNVWVKGYFFDAENKFYNNSNLISFFQGINNINDFISKIKEANGVFTVLIKMESKIFIASDTTRIFPLFYSFKGENLTISDDIEFLKEKLNISEIDKQSAKEFLSAAHTVGNKVLLKDIFQLQSNEYVVFENDRVSIQNFFFSYSTKQTNNTSYEQQKEQAKNAFENAFKRLIISLKNKHVVIPLSGGYDSRFITVMLKKHRYENVTCFTYGRKNNFELENAKKTAEKLNYKWVFIEYNKSLFGNFSETNIFKEYAHYVGKYSSMPLLQEYFAVKYLKDNKIIPNDSIFIPGHSGDLLGGSQFVKILKEDLKTKEICSLLLKKKFFLSNSINSRSFETKKIICDNLLNFDSNYKDKIPYSVTEDYDIKEKIAKFIFNSSSVYNFFGYEHRFPFWDKELLSFFKDVPYKYKKMKLLYDDVLKNSYFNLFNTNFDKEIQTTNFELIIQKLKNKIKPFLPYSIKKKFLLKNDKLNSSVSTNQIIQLFKEKNLPYNPKIKSYNEIIIKWYYYFSKGLIK